PALGEFLSRSLRLVIALTLPCAVGLGLLAREVLTLLFSARLAQAAPSLQLLALTIVPFCAVMVLSRGLVATNNQRIDLLGNLVAVAVNLALNLWLIASFGAAGAAAAQFLSMLALLLIVAVWSRRRLYRLEWRRTVTTAIVPLALMSVVVWQARSLGFWIAMVAGALVWLAAALLTQRELRMALSRQA
ncbi:MAG TPA: oligosaccharide flippase family protein, partial [Blastocatellia bacterium]|nr:oligosaccharide flippase family protein [Blastocatellia bacterium]